VSTARKRRRYLRWVRYDLRCASLTGPDRGLLKPGQSNDPHYPRFTHNGRLTAAQALDRATRAHYDPNGQNIRVRRPWPPRS